MYGMQGFRPNLSIPETPFEQDMEMFDEPTHVAQHSQDLPDAFLRLLQDPQAPKFNLADLPSNVVEEVHYIASPRIKAFHSQHNWSLPNRRSADMQRPTAGKQDMSRAFSMPFIQSPLGHFGAPSPGPGPELPSDDFVELINAPRHVSPDILRVSQDSFGSMHSQRKRKHHTGALGISASMPNGDWLSDQLDNTTRQTRSPRPACLHCGIKHTPQWRMGPEGPRTLCNACGVKFKKSNSQRE